VKKVNQQQLDWVNGVGYKKKVLLVGDDLNQAGALVQLVRIEPATSVAPHYHMSCTEVFHIIQGSGFFVIEGTEYRLGPGDTLTCEPREVHETRNDDEEYAFEYIVFKTNVVDNDIFWVTE
jgi:quercetin dioxygenase-like cupin family protein